MSISIEGGPQIFEDRKLELEKLEIEDFRRSGPSDNSPDLKAADNLQFSIRNGQLSIQAYRKDSKTGVVLRPLAFVRTAHHHPGLWPFFGFCPSSAASLIAFWLQDFLGPTRERAPSQSVSHRSLEYRIPAKAIHPHPARPGRSAR
jgi:hypothetical protein